MMSLRALIALILLQVLLISWGAHPKFKYDWIVGVGIGAITYIVAQHFIWNHT